MRLSSLITPWRFYDQYHDLNKFNIDCTEGCLYNLICDKSRLLPFQFQRPASNYPIVKAWLRKECTDFYNKIIPEQKAKFIDQSYFTVGGGLTYVNEKAKFVTPAAYLKKVGALIIGQKYRVKVIVSDKKHTAGQTCELYLENPTFATLIATVTDVGTHTVDFTALDTEIGLRCNITGANDYIKVSEFSVYQINDFSVINNDDYQVDETIFQIVNIGAKDIISACGEQDSTGSSLPCGRYYLIIQSVIIDPDLGGPVNTYFFSEVISIRDFLPSQSPYILLEWSNSCDLQDVKYTELNCNYVNRIYIDGPIIKPTYPFVEEGTNDANEVFKPTFKKLEKKEDIIAAGLPEFVADALMAIRLHNSIKFYRQLRKNQQFINEYEIVETMESDIEAVLDNCFSTVTLKPLLSGRFISTACCTSIEIVDAGCGCTYNVVNYDYPDAPELGDYAFVDGILYRWVEGGDFDIWSNQSGVTSIGDIICVSETSEYWYYKMVMGVGTWVQITNITSLGSNGLVSFTVIGFAPPGTLVKLKVIYNSITYILPGIYTDAQFAAGITINYADISFALIVCLPLEVSANAFNISCDYGYGPSDTIVPYADGSC